MIASSPLGKLLAGALALGLHGALVLTLAPETRSEIEGRAGAAEARVGSSFADMSAGVLQAIDPAKVAPVEVPETVIEPVPTPRTEPLKPKKYTALKPDASPRPLIAQPAPMREPAIVPTPSPKIAALPVIRPALTPPPEPAGTLAARDEVAMAVSTSVRPKPRTRVTATPAPARPKAKRQVRKQPDKTKRESNARKTARAGSVAGSEKGSAKTSGARQGKAKSQGNAAASNYPGRVMKRISRVPRPAVGVRGTATVAFTVSTGGGLAGVSVAKSSGSAKLDNAALRMVRRAAPFPAPPRGARRSFSIRIKGR